MKCKPSAIGFGENRLAKLESSYKGHGSRWLDETKQMVVPEAQQVLDNPVLTGIQMTGGAIVSVIAAGDELVDGAAKVISRNKDPIKGHDMNSPVAYLRGGADDIFGKEKGIPTRAVGVYNSISHGTKDAIRALTFQPGLKSYSTAA